MHRLRLVSFAVLALLVFGLLGYTAYAAVTGSGSEDYDFTVPAQTVTNADGTSAALSGTLHVHVEVPAPAPPPPPPPPPPPATLFNGDFETGNLSQWQHVINPSSSGPAPQAVANPHIQGNYAAQLTVAPSDSEGTPANSSRVDLYENANSAWASDGKDIWQHSYVMFPTSAKAAYPYRPTPGNWNWLFQWHSASSIIGGISATGGEPVEVGVQTGVSFTDTGCGYNSSGDVSKQELFGYFAGGDIAAGPVARHSWCLNAPLQYDHWYDVYFHIIWSKSASVGLFHLEIDGKVVSDLHQATLLYNSSTGATDVPDIELSNYRVQNSAVTWNSTVFYDGVKLGATRDSVAG